MSEKTISHLIAGFVGIVTAALTAAPFLMMLDMQRAEKAHENRKQKFNQEMDRIANKWFS